MSRRFTKQFLYGILYLAIFVLIGFWFYGRFIRVAPSCFDGVQNQNETGVDCGGVCARVCTANANRIEQVGNVFYSSPDAGHIELMAEVQNPNSDLAAKSFTYVFRLYQTDGTSIDVAGVSFLYADETKYIVQVGGAPPGVDPSKITRADFLAGSDVEWVAAETFTKPDVKVRDQQISNTASGVEVDGHVSNEGTIDVPSVFVTAIFYNSFGLVAGVSNTQLDAVASGDVRPFTIIHPAIAGLNPSATVVSVSAARP